MIDTKIVAIGLPERGDNPEHRTIEVDLKSTELHIDGIAVGVFLGRRAGTQPRRGPRLSVARGPCTSGRQPTG